MNGHRSDIWHGLLGTDAAAARELYIEVVGWRFDDGGATPQGAPLCCVEAKG